MYVSSIILHFDSFLCSENFEIYRFFFGFQGPPRTSNLLAPIMLLTGHEGDIFCGKFSPDGQLFASAGFDRLICKWYSHVIMAFIKCSNEKNFWAIFLVILIKMLPLRIS